MLRVLPLGGLGEVGMNCLALEQQGDILIIDCGVTFDDRGLGVDVIHPDFSPLERLGGRVVGVFVTHGHEDHIGALPYFLKRHDVPIWGPRYALGLVRSRLAEHEVLEHARLLEVRPGDQYDVGSFRVEPMRVTHSIADATGLAITTREGTVIHTGDFKFDESPPDGELFDVDRFRAFGDAGTTLLFSDSTNVDVPGPSGSESDVGGVLERLVLESTGAVVVGMFASNIHRLRILGEIAQRSRRRIVLLGRGVETHARVARATGYLPWPDELVLPEQMIREVTRDKILAIATGSQGEAKAALARLARGEHPAMDVGPKDHVIVSSRTIPGNEPDVHAILGMFIRRGARVTTRLDEPGVHVSGHAHRPDQRRMLELVRPKCFIPVHGTIHHMTKHAEVARGLGVENVAVIENGQIVEVSPNGLALGDRLAPGRVHVFAGREVPTSVLRERAAIAQEGVAVCSVAVDAAGIVLDVLLETRGVIDEDDSPEEIENVKDAIRRAVLDAPPESNDNVLAEHARLAIRRAFHKSRSIKPITIVHVRRGP